MTGILDCEKCRDWYYSLDENYVAAAASVGISRNMSTAEVLQAYVRNYHRRDHMEDRQR